MAGSIFLWNNDKNNKNKINAIVFMDNKIEEIFCLLKYKNKAKEISYLK